MHLVGLLTRNDRTSAVTGTSDEDAATAYRSASTAGTDADQFHGDDAGCYRTIIQEVALTLLSGFARRRRRKEAPACAANSFPGLRGRTASPTA